MMCDVRCLWRRESFLTAGDVVVREEQRLLDPGTAPASNFLAFSHIFKNGGNVVILVSPAWRFPAPAALSNGRQPASQLASCSHDSSLCDATLRKEQPEAVFSSSSGSGSD
jgi:hypothetical protein